MVRKILASDWHTLAGILDGGGCSVLYEKLVSGMCINKSAWTFIEPS